jgi:hypothetical protein
MSFRRFEMNQYCHVLSRMRLGDTDRSIARSGLMGRKKSAQLRLLASNVAYGTFFQKSITHASSE